MTRKFKKPIASLVAVVSLLTCITGINANASAMPTITKQFTVGNSTARATAYRDSTHATASTSLSGGRCSVTLKYCSKTVTYTNYINKTPSATISGSSGTAKSSHTATKGGYSNSTSLTY